MPSIFIALTPVKDLNNQLIEIKKDLKNKLLKNQNISWQNNNNHHITLKFIGSMEPEQIEQLYQNLEKITSARSQISVEIKTISLFPNENGQVLVANIAPTPQLKKINSKIEEIINIIGFETNLKAFRPHITLGRFKDKEREYLEFPALEEPIKSLITCVDVYESEFDSGKTTYNLLRTFRY